jgi:predicted phage terminase large subunit-like protein
VRSRTNTDNAARRLAIQCTAQEDLYFFSRWMFMQRKGYQWQRARQHQLICDALMRVFAGQSKRLIINVPPRYSKTELAVVNFIAWAFGKVPDCEFIHASYSAALAINNSAAVSGVVQHEAYRELFAHTRLANTAQHHWKTTAGGVMYATGTGGTITGFGAGKHRPGFGGAIIIDDPHKADEARSDVMRQGVIDWFQNTLESRKNSPETPIIVIMQRLHARDLAGWLLEGGNGEAWDHVCIPARNADGSALWPQKHSVQELHRMERAAPYVFAGQYLQRPAPPQGGVIKPDRLEVIDALPAAAVQWVRGWDLAATLDGDYTVGAKLGRLPDGRLVIGDMVRIRCGPDERDAALKNTASRDGKGVRISLPQDPGQAGKTQALYLTRQLAGYPVSTSPESGDKMTRAEPLAAQINVGNVLMLRGPWMDELVNEMRMFPNGSNDDQVDALARAFAALMGGNTGMLDFVRQQVEGLNKED